MSLPSHTLTISPFDTYFAAVRKNVIFVWVKFNQRVLKPGEAINTFIQDLHRLAKDCDYGALKDELIRDRIVVGVADDDLSDDLQTRANLTLADAVQIARQAKAHKEGQEVRGKGDFVKHGRLPSPKNCHHHQKNPHNWHKPFNKQHPSQCSYCGREPHKREYCPATVPDRPPVHAAPKRGNTNQSAVLAPNLSVNSQKKQTTLQMMTTMNSWGVSTRWMTWIAGQLKSSWMANQLASNFYFFTKRIHSSKPASLNRPISLMLPLSLTPHPYYE